MHGMRWWWEDGVAVTCSSVLIAMGAFQVVAVMLHISKDRYKSIAISYQCGSGDVQTCLQGSYSLETKLKKQTGRDYLNLIFSLQDIFLRCVHQWILAIQVVRSDNLSMWLQWRRPGTSPMTPVLGTPRQPLQCPSVSSLTVSWPCIWIGLCKHVFCISVVTPN